MLLLATALGACGGGGGGGGGGSSGGGTPPPPSTYTVGGTVSGLVSSGLVLQVNGGGNLAVAAKATSFTFSSALASGAAYAVTVLTQPSNPAQTCTVTSGSGTVGSANVTSVSIACTAPVVTTKYTVGGTISGLASSGLVLGDNVGDHLTVTAGSTTFTLPTSFASGSTYTVSVSTQPSTLVCTVANGSGTVGSANVTSVAITCSAPTYKIGGTISGLTSAGLVLQDNAGDNLTVPAKATTFTFATGLKTGATYAVTVLTQPSAPAEVCTVTNGTGPVGSAPITSVTVSCARVGQFVFVANATDGANNNGDVSAFAINSTTGALTAVAGSPFSLGTGDSDPTGIAVDENGHVYVANTGSSNVSFFDIGTNGVLSFSSDYTTSGTVGDAIAVSASGTSMYTAGSSTASFTSGSVSGFTITSSTGALTLTPNVPYSAGNPLVGIAIDPAAQLVFTTQGSTDFITAYVINSDGSLTGANGDPLSTGLPGNPAGVVTSPLGTSTGGFLYVANPAANSVSGYSYLTANAPPSASGNLLTPVPGTTEGTTGVFLTQGSGPTGIAIDPAGKYLYVANYQDGNVSSFSIDPQTGSLTLIGMPVGTGNLNGVPAPDPIAVQVDPSGKFVYVVNQADNSVSVFGAAAGTLTLLNTYPCGIGATAVAVE